LATKCRGHYISLPQYCNILGTLFLKNGKQKKKKLGKKLGSFNKTEKRNQPWLPFRLLNVSEGSNDSQFTSFLIPDNHGGLNSLLLFQPQDDALNQRK